MTPKPRKHRDRVRAVGYVRVSSEQQAESGLSLEHQQEKVRALAMLNDYELAEIVVDAGESAASLDRPGIVRVLEMVDHREVEAVLIAKLDRATRSVRDLADLLDRFNRRQVALVSASESVNTGSAAGRMVLNVMTTVAQWEREAIGERTRDALTAKRRRGERYSRYLPYGTHLDPDGSTLRPHADELDALRFIAECRGEAGLTWNATAEALNREGYRTRAGSPWTWHNARKAHHTASRRAD